MNYFRTLLIACFVCASTGATLFAADDPTGVIVGWDRHDGDTLLGELNCVGCHQPSDSLEVSAKQPPLLGNVGQRVTPQYLRKFLAEPHKVKAGTTMPDMLHGLAGAEKEQTVEKLTHYLASLGGPIDQRSSGSSLAQIERGRELYHTIGCVACHQAYDPPPKHKKDPTTIPDDDEPVAKPTTPAIPFGDLASKTTVDVLASFLQDPLHVRPSGRMPALGLKPGEARTIAAYLLRDQYDDKEVAPGVGLDFAYYEGSWQNVPDFEKLTPKVEGDAKTIDMQEIQQKVKKQLKSNFGVRFQGLIDIPETGLYRFWTKSDDGSMLRIDDKLIVNNDGQHPPTEKAGEVQLTKGRHVIQLDFTQGGGGWELSAHWQPPSAKARSPIPAGVLLHSAAAMIPKGIVNFEVDPQQAEQGKQLFGTLGCASCHSVDNKPVDATLALKAPELSKLDTSKGCLSQTVAKGQPKYDLNDPQRDSLRKVVVQAKTPKAWTTARKVDRLMMSMNCYRCHTRGEKGGPDPARSDYFAYDIVVDLGDEGRLPPPLDHVGGKLSKVGFDDALEGLRYRTYMATRMPQFGKANVGHVPEMFAKLDAGAFPPRKTPFSGKLIDNGRTLVGKNTLACINCHTWGSQHLPGAEGLDLQLITRRINPSWFHAFLADPQKLKPRTRMPTAFNNGESFFKDIQGGDMHKQIDAIWAYLAAGGKGGLPPGLSPSDTSMLVPVDEPIVFRTFLNQVSAHAILVGFRQRTHVAFDANRVRLAVAWTGDFVSTKPTWDGRAGQYTSIPSNDILRFPEGPGFTTLKSRNEPWPVDLPKKKLGSARTPEGYRFRGYRFDEERTPTFLYEYNSIRVAETPSTDFRANESFLRRKFVLSAMVQPENVYFRIAVGKSIREVEGEFVVDDRQRYRVTGTKSTPIVREVAGQTELLLAIEFVGDGKQTEAKFDVELTWQ